MKGLTNPSRVFCAIFCAIVFVLIWLIYRGFGIQGLVLSWIARVYGVWFTGLCADMAGV